MGSEKCLGAEEIEILGFLNQPRGCYLKLWLLLFPNCCFFALFSWFLVYSCGVSGVMGSRVTVGLSCAHLGSPAGEINCSFYFDVWLYIVDSIFNRQ